MQSSRKYLSLAAAAVAVSLLCGPASADTAKKNATPSMGWDNPTVGVFGAPPKGTASEPAGRKSAAPPAPVAAPALPKVDAEPAQMNTSMPGVSSLPAAPRPDARAEGPAVGSPSSAAPMAPLAPAAPPTGFLPDHPFLSGLVAGLVGTDIGQVFYGGPMMGDETAAMIGFLVRIVLLGLLTILGVRLIWGLMNGGRGGAPADYAGGRREPSFGRQADAGDGRREPTLGRSDEPALSRPREARSGLSARRRP